MGGRRGEMWPWKGRKVRDWASQREGKGGVGLSSDPAKGRAPHREWASTVGLLPARPGGLSICVLSFYNACNFLPLYAKQNYIKLKCEL